MISPRSIPRVLAAAVLILSGAALAGCAAAERASSVSASQSAEPSPSSVDLEIDNCGTTVDFTDAAPERVVTIKSSTTELLLALGLGDRIVGTAFQDGPVPEPWADDAAGLPSIADKVPSQEAVLEVEPDLVYAGWESNFSPEGAGDRTDLEALGINTYVSPSACKEPGYRPEKLRFDDVFAEIEEVAAIFRADATDLIEEQRTDVASVEPVAGEPTALWFSSGSDTPFVGAGIGAPQLVMETIGLRNIADDIEDSWAPYNWESVVDADPDVIVLVDASWNTADKKIELLRSNPATANLSAVVSDRYLVIPFAASEAGVRTAPATVELATQLAELDLP